MASILNGTGVTFSDGTALPSAAPTISQVGGIISACYIVTGPAFANIYPGNSGFNSYDMNLTVSGASLAYNIKVSVNVTNGYYRNATPIEPVVRAVSTSSPGTAFPASNTSATNYYWSYSTNPGGSWRSLQSFSTKKDYVGCCGYFTYWPQILWQRYA